MLRVLQPHARVLTRAFTLSFRQYGARHASKRCNVAGFGQWPVVAVCTQRAFHTSCRRAILPAPAGLFLAAPALMRAVPFVVTRFVRRYIWPRLKPETRALLSRILYCLGLALYVGLGGYAALYVQTVDETGRRRLLLLSNAELMFLDKMIRENLPESLEDDLKGKIVSGNDPRFIRIAKVMNRLKAENTSAQDIKWELAVIDSPVANAVSLPGGTVAVFTGILDIARSPDELAVLLGHEMAHTILRHQEEKLSRMKLRNLIMLPITVFVNAFAGLTVSSIFYFGENQISQYLIDMPSSRVHEAEADRLGMRMAGKACYDVSVAPEFFARLPSIPEELEWMSTHPTGRHRKEALLEQLDSVRAMSLDKCKGFRKQFWRIVKDSQSDTRSISHTHQLALRQLAAAVEAEVETAAKEGAAAKVVETGPTDPVVNSNGTGSLPSPAVSTTATITSSSSPAVPAVKRASKELPPQRPEIFIPPSRHVTNEVLADRSSKRSS